MCTVSAAAAVAAVQDNGGGGRRDDGSCDGERTEGLLAQLSAGWVEQNQSHLQLQPRVVSAEPELAAYHLSRADAYLLLGTLP